MGILKKYGIDAEIDDEMIPVISELNKLGLKTNSCCSGHGDRKPQAHLGFDIKDCVILVSHGGVSINWKRKKKGETKALLEKVSNTSHAPHLL